MTSISTPPPPATTTRPVPQAAVPHSRLSHWSMRHRWLVVLAGVAVLVGAGWLLAGGITTTDDQDQLVGDSAEARAVVADADFGDRPTERIVVTSRAGDLTPQDTRRLGAELQETYAGLPGIAAVGEPIPAPDGRSLVLELELATGGGAAEIPAADLVSASLDATEQLADAHPELEVGQVGDGSIDREIDATIGKDFERAEMFSIPITLVILFVAFGAVVAAGVPLLLGLSSVVVALGLTALASRHLVPVDPTTQSLVLLIGLAVGVDYSLFIMRRVQEEMAAGRSRTDAIAVAGATAGRAVVISGLTVVVAMAGMLVAGGLFTSLAVGAMLVVAVAVGTAAVLLPALLAVLGRGVDRLRIPGLHRLARRRGTDGSLWARLAGRVSRKPWAWGGVTAALLLALAAPAVGMKTELGSVDVLPGDLQVVQAYHQLERAVPTDGGQTVDVVVKADAADAGRVTRALADAAGTATGIDHVAQVADELTTSVDGTVTVQTVALDVDPSDEAFGETVGQIRDRVVPEIEVALADVPSAEVHVGGGAESSDLAGWMDERLPWVVGFVLLLTLAVMLFSFGSPWLAGATVALNLLSVGAAYGVLTLVFQHGLGEHLLGFSSIGAVEAWLPLLMFVILFGLSMDYHVFVTSRVREARDSGLSPAAAVRQGVGRSAGVVTAAAAVMIGVFSVFGMLSTLDLKELGVGLATAILLDATLVRGVLLPAVLTVLGDRAHNGPAWLPRWHH
jgi:putative drug exporter of the RND superfamily